MVWRRLSLLLAAAAATLVAGCGDGAATAGEGERRPVLVSAAASLSEALTSCQDAVAGVRPRLSFAGSDELAAQLRQGVEPDVYLAASTSLPRELAAEGLLQEPVAFATNELVLAVPAGSSLTAVEDLVTDDVALVVGSESVPVGAYTREVLARLGPARAQAILAQVRSSEPDVRGIVGKLAQGAAGAGFVYASDVEAAGGALTAIALPGDLQPAVAYGGAVVDGAPHPEAAQAYLDAVVSGPCARALRAAGFGPPPS